MKSIIQGLLRPFGVELRRAKRELPYQRQGDFGRFSTPNGDFLLPLNAKDDIILKQIKSGQVFEPEVTDVASRFIKKGSAVLDLGANFGQMSLLFSRMVGSSGVVHSFEAQRAVFELLKRNIEINGVANVRPTFGAVLNETGRVLHFPAPDFTRFASYGSYNVPLDATQGDEVTSLQIDDIDFDRPISFMKVDVQGCDLFALQGAKNTIEKHKMPILFEFEQRFQNEYGTTFQDYVKFVNDINYQFVETILDINYLIMPK